MGVFIDLSGRRFGRWTVLHRTADKKRPRWACRCDCGKERLVLGGSLRRGSSTSCGCWHYEQFANLSRVMNKTHGYTRTPTYRSWRSMLNRCTNRNTPGFHRYGGRGIAVCERWAAFENFLADMGERPDGTTLERDNANGDYKPGNCRWATMAEQGNNRSDNVVLEFQGRRMTISQWAAELGVKWSTIKNRVKRGWPIKRVLTERVGKYSRA